MADAEPLVLTLEEAMRMIAFKHLDELREARGNLADVQLEITESGWWVFLNDGGAGTRNKIREFDSWTEAASFALGRPVVARDGAADLLPVGDALTAYNDLLGEWEHRKRTYGKYEARHPVRLREAVREADGAGLVLAGDAIQSLVHEAAVEYVRADQLMQDHLRGVAVARDEAAELRAENTRLRAAARAWLDAERHTRIINAGATPEARRAYREARGALKSLAETLAGEEERE